MIPASITKAYLRVNAPFRLLLFYTFICLFGLLMQPTASYSVPKNFSVQIFLANQSDTFLVPLEGMHQITLQLLSTSNAVLYTKDTSSYISKGLLTLDLSLNTTKALTSFNSGHNKIKVSISPQSNTDDINTALTDEIILPLNALTHAKVSNSSILTRNFLSPRALQIHYPTNNLTATVNISIATQSATEKLFVDGTVRGYSFRGDGSKITNVDLSIWTKTTHFLYYTKGFVGMGLDNPLVSLHVAASANIEQNALILGKLQSTFKGKSDHITSYNATYISTGSMGPYRLFGYYPTIAGTGTIQTGQWQSPSIIQDSYISNDLSLNNSTLISPTLQGTLKLSPKLSFINKNAPFNIHSKNWSLSQHSRISTLNTRAITMNATALLYNHYLHIQQKPHFLHLNSLGDIGIGTTNIGLNTLTLDNGVTLSDTNDSYAGMIKYHQSRLKGYVNNRWKLLDKTVQFSGFSLFPDDTKIYSNPNLAINTSGDIGLGTPHPLYPIHMQGNVIFLHNPYALPPSNNNPNTSYLTWVSNKSSLRIGQHLRSQPFGMGSLALGVSSNATSTGSISVTTGQSTSSAPYSIVLGSKNANNHLSNSVIFASHKIDSPSTFTHLNADNIMFSSDSFNNTHSLLVSGNNNIIFSNSSISSLPHSHTYIFGIGIPLRTAIGSDSFIWHPTILGTNTYNKSFVIGSKMSINREPKDGTMLTVQGTMHATQYFGYGKNLDNIASDSLKVSTILSVRAVSQVSPNSIYISNHFGHLPKDTISSDTIHDNSIESDDFDSYIISKRMIAPSSIDTDQFSNASVQTFHIVNNSLDGRVFSDLATPNFYEDVANSDTLGKDSITTEQLANSIFLSDNNYLAPNIINSINISINNIKDGEVRTSDLNQDLYISMYFATANIHGTHITRNAILEHHITPNALYAKHILPGSVTSMNIQHKSILSHHIKTDTITSSHFAQDKIATLRTLQNTAPIWTTRHFKNNVISPPVLSPTLILDASYITPNAILSSHISNQAIVETHITHNALSKDAFDSGAITSYNILDRTIHAPDIAYQTIISTNIMAKSITEDKIASESISGDNFIPKTISANYIASGAIYGTHIQDNAIESHHITPNTLSKESFSARAFIGSKFKPDAISSANLSEYAISSANLRGLIIEQSSIDIIAENSIPWESTDSYIPIEKVPTLAIQKLSLDPDGITSKNLAINVIATETLADSFKIDLLSDFGGPLMLSKGGTGLTNADYIHDSILLVETTTNSEKKLGQPPNFRFNNDALLVGLDASQTNTDSKNGLIVSGNLRITSGSLTVDQNEHSGTYNIHLEDHALLFKTDNNALLGLKSRALYSKDYLLVGTASSCTPTCNMTVSGNVAIGTKFSKNNIAGLSNALTVQTKLHINRTGGHSAPLYVAKQTNDPTAIYAKSLTSPTILSDISTVPSLVSGLKTINTPIGIQSTGALTGISATATTTGIRVTMPDSSPVTGVSSTIKLSPNNTGSALSVFVNYTPPIKAYLGHAIWDTNTHKQYGVYGISPSNTHTAALLDGNVHIPNRLVIGDYATPPSDHTLHVQGPAFFNGLQIHTYKSNNNTQTIDWKETSIYHLNITYSTFSSINFDPPKKSTHLLLKVYWENTGTSFEFNENLNIKWLAQDHPDTQSDKGVEHIYTFYYSQPEDTYYGAVLFDFK